MPQNLRAGFKGASFRCFEPAGGGQGKGEKKKKHIFKGGGVCQFKIRNVSGIFMLLKLQYIAAD